MLNTSVIPTISRRKILIAGGLSMLNLALDNPVLSFVTSIGTKVGGLTDYSKSAIETKHQELSGATVVGITNEQLLLKDPLFTVSNIGYEQSDGTFGFVYKTTIGKEAKALNLKVANNDPNSLLQISRTGMLIAPIGYKEGAYYRFKNSRGNSTVRLMYPALTTNGLKLGSNEIVDRFPGLGEDLNRASGGYYINNGSLKLTDKNGLQTAKDMNIPFAQMVYYMDQDNSDIILNATWSKSFDADVKIGDTAYYWSLYGQVINKLGINETFILTSADNMVPISHMIQLVQAYSIDGNFKAVLSDGGNGSSIVYRTSDDPKLGAIGVNGFDTHLSPMALAFV